jgi:antitoxin PrlF
MKALVTARGQVTIPKPLRDQFGISPGQVIDFVADEDGIRLRKVVDRNRRESIIGCWREELAGRTVAELMDELRGPVELPPPRHPPSLSA